MRKILGVVLLAWSSLAWADGTAVWLGAGVGAAIGVVTLPDCSAPRSCSEFGALPIYTANLTYASPQAAVRIRGLRADERKTLDDPRELAFLVGGRTDGGALLMVGGGRLFDADDSHPKPLWGLALELIYAPLKASSSGAEFSVHGNIADGLYYGGFSMGIRFGDLGGSR
jgi:hypothetical protein